MSVLPYYMARRRLGPAGGGGSAGTALFHIANYGGTATGFNHNITDLDIGAEDPNRNIIVAMNFFESPAPTATVTINGVEATERASAWGNGAGAKIFSAVVPSGTTGVTVAVSLSRNADSFGMAVYRMITETPEPLDSGGDAGAKTMPASWTASDIEVANGGCLIIAARTNSDDAVIIDYSGVDELTEDKNTGKSLAWSCSTTEDATTNDVSVSEGANVKALAVVSWAP